MYSAGANFGEGGPEKQLLFFLPTVSELCLTIIWSLNAGYPQFIGRNKVFKHCNDVCFRTGNNRGWLEWVEEHTHLTTIVWDIITIHLLILLSLLLFYASFSCSKQDRTKCHAFKWLLNMIVVAQNKMWRSYSCTVVDHTVRRNCIRV